MPSSHASKMVVGILLGKAGCHVQALAPSVAASFRGYPAPSLALQRARGRACVRRRPGAMRLSAEAGSGGAGDIDSSELYADMRLRLEVRIRQRAPGGVVGSWGGDGWVARARSELSKMPECRSFEQPVLLMLPSSTAALSRACVFFVVRHHVSKILCWCHGPLCSCGLCSLLRIAYVSEVCHKPSWPLQARCSSAVGEGLIRGA